MQPDSTIVEINGRDMQAFDVQINYDCDYDYIEGGWQNVIDPSWFTRDSNNHYHQATDNRAPTLYVDEDDDSDYWGYRCLSCKEEVLPKYKSVSFPGRQMKTFERYTFEFRSPRFFNFDNQEHVFIHNEYTRMFGMARVKASTVGSSEGVFYSGTFMGIPGVVHAPGN